jgi:GNAT superfamily N-acetyltransferase
MYDYSYFWRMTNEELIFRQAEDKEKEKDEIWQIMLDAKAQMKRLGSKQWQDDYPTRELIAKDIQCGMGYVLDDGDEVIAYAAVVYTGEPLYEHLVGQWLDDEPYVVVHRLAVAEKMKKRGIATLFMKKVEMLSRDKGVFRFRIDTNFDNHYMLNMFKTLGFVYRGSVDYGAHGSRMAFDKSF